MCISPKQRHNDTRAWKGNGKKFLEFNFQKFILIFKGIPSLSQRNLSLLLLVRLVDGHIWSFEELWWTNCFEIIDSPHAVNWLAKFIIRLFTTHIIGTTGRLS